MKQDELVDLDYSAIFKAWEGREDEWLNFSEILKIARSDNEGFRGKSGKVRFIRKLNRLVKTNRLVKNLHEDRSTWYKPTRTFDVAISSVAEELRKFSETEISEVELDAPGKSNKVSEDRRLMIAGIVDSAKKILLEMLGLPPEANLYIGLFRQKDGTLVLSIRQPSGIQQRRLHLGANP